MKPRFCIMVVLLSPIIFSCSAPQYFHDTSSFERQKELRSTHSGNVFSDVFIGVSTVCLAAVLESDIQFEPHEQSFKNLKLINVARDTMYVNMLTDLYWDENNYCDFLDIRIPPLKTCKVMVPINASYHLYFSVTPESDDDEMLQIFTSETKRIELVPGSGIRKVPEK